MLLRYAISFLQGEARRQLCSFTVHNLETSVLHLNEVHNLAASRLEQFSKTAAGSSPGALQLPGACRHGDLHL